MKKLVAGLLKKRNILDDCVIKCDTVRNRLSRHRLVVNQLGSISPIAAIELIIVTIIIQMARICQCLTPSKGLKLVNDVISGTNIQ